MDVQHLIGDAFQADNPQPTNSNNGQYLSDAVSYVSDVGSSMSPKCNSVSFFKPEARPDDCRSGVAVSERFICYTVKGILLRVIDTTTGDKTLLKGHTSFITDVFFSGVNQDALCSADMNRSEAGLFFWRLISADGSLMSEVINRFSVPACMVRPHPVCPDTWAVSDGADIAVLSAQQSSETVRRYSDLHMHHAIPDVVQGIEFSSDGSQLVVVAGSGHHSSVHVFKLPPSSELANLRSHRKSFVQQFHIPMANLKVASFITASGQADPVIVTAQSVAPSAEGAGSDQSNQLMLSVWSQQSFHDKPVTLIQSINVSLPSVSTNTASSGYHADMIVETSSKRSFVLLTHRSSNFVCVVAVSVIEGGLVLHHAVYLDLGKPILCLVPSIVEEMDSDPSSASKGVTQHLELTCLQDMMNLQHAVQQFHVPLLSVLPKPQSQSIKINVLPKFPATDTNVSVNYPSKSVTNEQPVNPFDSLIPPSNNSSRPNNSDRTPSGSQITLLRSGSGINPAGQPIDNFPYFALAKAEEGDKLSETATISSLQNNAPSSPFQLEEDSGASVPQDPSDPSPLTRGALPVQTGSKQQGLRLINFLRQNTEQSRNGELGATMARPDPKQLVPPIVEVIHSPPPADVNPFDDTYEAEAVSSPKEQAAVPSKGSLSKAQKRKIAIGSDQGARGLQKEQAQESNVACKDVLKEIKDLVSSECRQAMLDTLRADGWKDELCAQISNDLRVELTAAVNETVRESVREHLRDSVKNYLGKSFKSAFETTLVPAFQVGTAVLHSSLQNSLQSTTSSMEGLFARESAMALRFDNMQTEIVSLRETVTALTAEITRLRESCVNSASRAAEQYEENAMALLSQGRVAEAVETALEKRSVDQLLQVLRQTSADAVLGSCSKLLVLCIVQQLALDLSLNDPEEGVVQRLDWLKELVMAVVSGDVERKMSLDGGDQEKMDDTEAACITILQGVFDILKKAEARLAPSGPVRTDLRMLCSLVRSVE